MSGLVDGADAVARSVTAAGSSCPPASLVARGSMACSVSSRLDVILLSLQRERVCGVYSGFFFFGGGGGSYVHGSGIVDTVAEEKGA